MSYVPWSVWLGLTMWVAMFAIAGWSHVRVWQHGADRPWSVRLFSAGHVTFAITTALLPFAIILELLQSWRAALFGLLVFTTIALYASGGAMRAWETEQTRQRHQALGQAVAPRMISPWLLGAIWGILAPLVIGLVAVSWYMLVWPAPLVDPVGTQATFERIIIGATTVYLIGGGAHVYWQKHRRQSAHREVARRAREEVDGADSVDARREPRANNQDS